jgi:hypothetical protein
LARPRVSRLALASVALAAIGLAAAAYALAVRDTIPVAALALGAGPVAFVLRLAGLFLGRPSRAVAAVGLVLALLLMTWIGYVLWWVTTQSA